MSALIRPYHRVTRTSPCEHCRVADFGDAPVNPFDINDALGWVDEQIHADSGEIDRQELETPLPDAKLILSGDLVRDPTVLRVCSTMIERRHPLAQTLTFGRSLRSGLRRHRYAATPAVEAKATNSKRVRIK